MELPITCIYFIKQTAMTNNEIMKSSMLDIIFDNRNKEYGAYTLRREYPFRLLMALIATIALVFLIFLLSSFTGEKNSAIKNPTDDNTVVVRSFVAPKDLPNTPEKLLQLPKRTKPSASVSFTSQIKIEKDNKLKVTDVPDVNELIDKEISTENLDSLKKEGILNSIKEAPKNDGNGIIEETKLPGKEIIFSRSNAAFPGGDEALMRFFKQNLFTPGELSE